MSVKDRLEDAHLLLSSGRIDGAVLSYIVAAAATSRKRYPKGEVRSDGEAFKRFLREETLVMTYGRIKEWSLQILHAPDHRYVDRMMPLADYLYEFMRCELVHEGKLPSNVKLLDEPENHGVVRLGDDEVVISSSYITALSQVVVYAPENWQEFFPEWDLPDDVVGWMLFNVARDNPPCQEYLRQRRARLNALRAAAIGSSQTEHHT